MDPPLPGARTALYILEKHYQLVCFTTRDVEFVKSWLMRHGFPEMRVTNHKAMASVMLDDRAVRFEGEWTDKLIQQLVNFRPYWEDEARLKDASPSNDSPPEE